ncbi:MAG TPA: FMN-dependent NADH-azoreductase [Sphingobium sp.]
MNLLQIDSAITGDNSVTRQIGAAIVETARRANPGLNVTYRDLAADPIPHLDGSAMGKLRGGQGEANDPEVLLNTVLVEELLAADIVVIGAPMYNFSVPSQLKAWIDRVAVPGKTFRYTENGPLGLAGGKKVFIASARGGIYSEGPGAAIDFQEPFLRQVFAFFGIDDVTFIRAEGVAYGPDHFKAALDAAISEASGVLPLAA